MLSSFPSMDPYIEVSCIWSDFYDALAGELRALLHHPYDQSTTSE